MPCDTRTTVTKLDLSKMDVDKLTQAAKDAGWQVTNRNGVLQMYKGDHVVVVQNGKAQVTSYNTDGAGVEAELKRAYAVYTVKTVGKAYGMKVKSEKVTGDRIQMRLGR